MKILTALLFICCLYQAAHCQLQVQNGLYMFNPLVVNPAYAGSRDCFSAVLNYRNQWLGMKGAPTYINLAVHAPLKSKHLGIGFSTNNYSIGASKSTGAYLDVSYRIRVNGRKTRKKTWLAAGVQGGVNFFRTDFSELRVLQNYDISYGQQIRSTMPSIGAGVYYYSNRYYAGISIPNFIRNKTNQPVNYLSTSHINIMGGIVIPISKEIAFKPSANIILVKNVPINVDINANLFFNDVRLSVGAMYRLSRSAGLNMLVNISDAIQLGYAYEHNFTKLSPPGTHELVIIFDLKKDKTRVAPRYF